MIIMSPERSSLSLKDNSLKIFLMHVTGSLIINLVLSKIKQGANS